jgi:hypothetical protein
MALARASGVPTPNIHRLAAFFDPATPPLPEGSAKIPLDWRGVAAWGAGLGALLAVIFWISGRLRHEDLRSQEV